MKHYDPKLKKGKSSHLNILLFHNIHDKPKAYKISKHLLKYTGFFTACFFITGICSFTVLIKRYNEARKKVVKYDKLQKQVARQRINIELFAKKLEEFETKVVKLENFDKKLRAITSLAPPKTILRPKEKWSVGGPDMAGFENISTIISKDQDAVFNSLFSNLDRLFEDTKRQLESFEELNSFFKNQSNMLSSIPTVWPVKGWITSSFGYRRSPFTGRREIHEGIDIASKRGGDIVSPADGVVVRAGTESGYGKMIEIDHGYGFVTRYGHNSKHFVKVGDKVKRGQVIATVGNTGRSTGPHLHYEIELNGVPVDPLKYILHEEG